MSVNSKAKITIFFVSKGRTKVISWKETKWSDSKNSKWFRSPLGFRQQRRRSAGYWPWARNCQQTFWSTNWLRRSHDSHSLGLKVVTNFENFDAVAFWITWLVTALPNNLFVTSKNGTTNSPIHEFKVLHKGQRAFKNPFLMVYYI